MKCPGQNTQFWKPEDVFEVTCGQCGYPVEFFKTDGSRTCPDCHSRIKNPKLNLGCAQWCTYAKECLGFDSQDVSFSHKIDLSFADRLIKAVKHEFGDDRKRIHHALLVFDQALKILQKENGDPRVITAAALLHNIGIKEAERKYGSSEAHYQEVEGPPIAQRIMDELGFDKTTIQHVCDIISSHHSGDIIDTPEFRIIRDADKIAYILLLSGVSDKSELYDFIKDNFKTDTGKKIAQKLLGRT